MKKNILTAIIMMIMMIMMVGLVSAGIACSQSSLVSGTDYDVKAKSLVVTVNATTGVLTDNNATGVTGTLDGNSVTLTLASAALQTYTVNLGTQPTLNYKNVIFTVANSTDSTACTTVTDVTLMGQKATKGNINVDVSEAEKASQGFSSNGFALVIFLVIVAVVAVGMGNKKG